MCKGTLESTLFGFTKRLVEVCNKVRQSLDFAISLGAKFPHEIKSIKDSSQEGSGKRTWEDSFKSSQSGTKKKPKVQSEEKTLHNCCGTYHEKDCYYDMIQHPDLNKYEDLKFDGTVKGTLYSNLRVSQLGMKPGGLIAKWKLNHDGTKLVPYTYAKPTEGGQAERPANPAASATSMNSTNNVNGGTKNSKHHVNNITDEIPEDTTNHIKPVVYCRENKIQILHRHRCGV
jgi:hypothetical protein